MGQVSPLRPGSNHHSEPASPGPWQALDGRATAEPSLPAKTRRAQLGAGLTAAGTAVSLSLPGPPPRGAGSAQIDAALQLDRAGRHDDLLERHRRLGLRAPALRVTADQQQREVIAPCPLIPAYLPVPPKSLYVPCWLIVIRQVWVEALRALARRVLDFERAIAEHEPVDAVALWSTAAPVKTP